ncbi:MAG: peptidyl-prolyl cis-trans isomerase [Deltaproteobacteria bacterium]|nr:peptidyl-prolyl cis-trans isomerase [Deltaproteobacteria bacterium]
MPVAFRRLIVVVVLVSAACGRRADVVVVVDGVELRAADVSLAGSRDRLVDQALLAGAADKLGLDIEPDVTARVRKAERDALAAAVLERVVRDATSDEAVRRAWEERREHLARKRIHVRHIVLRDGVDATAVLARVRAGADFAAVARELDPGNGGELPPLFEGQVDAAFFTAAWALQAGETSDVVVSAHARHIIRALESPTVVAPSFEEARSALVATLGAEATAQLLQRLRADGDVEIVGPR